MIGIGELFVVLNSQVSNETRETTKEAQDLDASFKALTVQWKIKWGNHFLKRFAGLNNRNFLLHRSPLRFGDI